MTHLSTRQIIFRILFMLVAIGVVTWFFPHNEAFRYDYEVGKPWRYGRLTAPYDFAIYRSDSAVMQMEDSLRRQIVPRYWIDNSVADNVLQEQQQSHEKLSDEARSQLRHLLEHVYRLGVVTGDEYQSLTERRAPQVILVDGNDAATVPTSQLISERQAYELIRNDSLYANDFAKIDLQHYLHTNLTPDSAAMRLEYARLRQQVSATSGVVLAESRIIDQGEIVTPHTFDILESYKREQQERLHLLGDETLTVLGRFVLVALLLSSILLFVLLYRPWIYFSDAQVFVAIASVSVMVVLTSLAHKFAVGAVYMVPIGIVTILLSTFHGSRTAYYCHVVMVLLCSFIAPSHYEYVIIQSVVGMIIIFNLKDGIQDRSQLMHVALLSAAGYTVTYALYTLSTEGSLTNISIPILSMMLINAVLLLLSYLIIYAMENIFGFVSGITLTELCNMSRGLLLKLSQEAPGTFQHSLQVSNLAANAAKQIGANPALVRTGAMYHDIGKLWNPQMYTENQQGTNPHDGLTIEESVEVIKRHVTEGLELARREKLPREICEFIETHHGTALVKYFYVTWCNAHPDQEPDMKLFCYGGPAPTSKEQAILMFADCIEAASRSLKEFTHESISRLVNSLVDGIVQSGQLNDAKISLRDIQQCKECFIRDIEMINHVRIAYPDLKK